MKVVQPDELAERFLVQYHKIQEGGVEALKGERTFTPEQTMAIYNSIKMDPTNMVLFLGQVGYLIRVAMDEKHGENSDESRQAVEQFMVVMFSILVPALSTMMQENEVLSHMLEQSALSELDNFTKDGGAVDADPTELFKNLDFQLPDFDSLNGKDIN